MPRRVVVTGTGLLSPLGDRPESVCHRLESGDSAVRLMDEWEGWKGLRTRLGAPVPHRPDPSLFTQRETRSMGGAALYACAVTRTALDRAGLSDDPVVRSGRCGVAYGSGTGSPGDLAAFATSSVTREVRGLTATSYHRMMAHTCAANIGIVFGVTGRLLPTSSACTSGSQAVGFAYETIRSGAQDVMIAGGAEELSAPVAAVFDVMFATSVGLPGEEPRPFDGRRSGMVVGEGACTVILEEYEHARRRGADIIGEIIGFATNSDGAHVTNPQPVTMERVMRAALLDAGVTPGEVGYVNAHATGTRVGDAAEAAATAAVYGGRVPVSSLKGHIGHTLGACGAIEAVLTLEMLRRGTLVGTRNMDAPVEGPYLFTGTLPAGARVGVSNTFAFGGVNTSLVMKV